VNRNPTNSNPQNKGLYICKGIRKEIYYYIVIVHYLDARKISCLRYIITNPSVKIENAIHDMVQASMICEVKLEKSGLSAALGGESAGGYYRKAI
jgi:hypothetical protein